MTLIDTTDSILMLGAYGWAFVKPIRKLYYNLTITAVSVIVAVVVGRLETLNLIGDQLGLTDGGRLLGRGTRRRRETSGRQARRWPGDGRDGALPTRPRHQAFRALLRLGGVAPFRHAISNAA